jgi:glutathione synthase
VSQVIIQEGVHTYERVGSGTDEGVAEPVVYMIDRFVVGGFYRVHSGRGKDENLNAPGMHFEPLAFETSCSLPDHARTRCGAEPLLRLRRRCPPGAARCFARTRAHRTPSREGVAMRIAFIVDPLPSLKAYKDTSIAMMRAAQATGHAVWAVQQAAIPARFPGRADAQGPALRHRVRDHHLAARTCRSRGRARLQPAARCAIIRRSSRWPISQFAPPTAGGTRSRQLIHLSSTSKRDTILKPLDGMGGSQIFRVRHDDPNRNVIIETLTHDGARTIMAQRFIPEIADGDKRILIIGGEVVPYCLARIPKAGETRGNLAPAAPASPGLTARDREIAEALAPVLAERGCCSSARRDRRLADRDQRHQPDLHGRNRRADRLRRRGDVHRRARHVSAPPVSA